MLEESDGQLQIWHCKFGARDLESIWVPSWAYRGEMNVPGAGKLEIMGFP